MLVLFGKGQLPSDSSRFFRPAGVEPPSSPMIGRISFVDGGGGRFHLEAPDTELATPKARRLVLGW